MAAPSLELKGKVCPDRPLQRAFGRARCPKESTFFHALDSFTEEKVTLSWFLSPRAQTDIMWAKGGTSASEAF